MILANGSKASSVPGSDGSGYRIAAKLGHEIIPPLPALVSLKCKGKNFSGWAGVRTEARVSLLADGQLIRTEAGEIQLTEYGVSGIPVFQISRFAVRTIREGRKAEILLDFFRNPLRIRRKIFAGERKPARTNPAQNCSSVFSGQAVQNSLQTTGSYPGDPWFPAGNYRRYRIFPGAGMLRRRQHRRDRSFYPGVKNPQRTLFCRRTS